MRNSGGPERGPASPTRPGIGRWATFTARATLLTSLVAILSVLVTTLVAVPVAVRAANREARTSLNRDATLIASLISTRPGDGEALAKRLRSQKIGVFLINAGKADRAGLPDWIVRTLTAGTPVGPRLAIVNGRARLLAGEPVQGKPGTAIALTAAPVNPTAGVVWGRLWLALLAGLLAGLVAGPLLAKRLTKPIRDAANAASLLSAGDRSIRLATDGPTEAVELAVAINNLASALAPSEGRQREFLLSVSHELRTPLTTPRRSPTA